MNATISPNNTQDIEHLLLEANNRLILWLIPAFLYLGAVMVLGFVGNLMVCYVFFFVLPLSTQNILTTALAVFELCNCVVTVPTEIWVMQHLIVLNEEGRCRFLKGFNHFTNFSSILTLVIIACHRYRMVCHPLKHQISLGQVKGVLLVAMQVAVVFAIPAGFLNGIHSTVVADLPKPTRECFFADSMKDTMYPLAYTLLLFCFFLVILVFLTLVYVRIWLELKRHNAFMSLQVGRLHISACRSSEIQRPRDGKKQEGVVETEEDEMKTNDDKKKEEEEMDVGKKKEADDTKEKTTKKEEEKEEGKFEEEKKKKKKTTTQGKEEKNKTSRCLAEVYGDLDTDHGKDTTGQNLLGQNAQNQSSPSVLSLGLRSILADSRLTQNVHTQGCSVAAVSQGQTPALVIPRIILGMRPRSSLVLDRHKSADRDACTACFTDVEWSSVTDLSACTIDTNLGDWEPSQGVGETGPATQPSIVMGVSTAFGGSSHHAPPAEAAMKADWVKVQGSAVRTCPPASLEPRETAPVLYSTISDRAMPKTQPFHTDTSKGHERSSEKSSLGFLKKLLFPRNINDQEGDSGLGVWPSLSKNISDQYDLQVQSTSLSSLTSDCIYITEAKIMAAIDEMNQYMENVVIPSGKSVHEMTMSVEFSRLRRATLYAIRKKPPSGQLTTLVAICITVTFFLSFLPYLSIRIADIFHEGYHQRISGASLVFYHIFLRSYLISPVTNPIIYGVLNIKFRKAVLAMICRR